MKRVIDIHRKDQRNQLVWTYVVSLGGDGTHPSIEDFKQEALRLAIIDKHGNADNLQAHVHANNVK